MRQRLVDAGKCKDVLGQRVHVLLRSVAVSKGDQQIEIANGLFPAAQRACRRNRFDGLSRLLDVCRNRGCRILCRINVKSSGGFLEYFHCFQNILFAFLAKARQVAKFFFSRKLFHVRYGGGLKIGPQESDFLRAQ